MDARLILILVIVGAALLFSWLEARILARDWRSFASRLGLKYNFGGILFGPEVSGHYHGRDLRLTAFIPSSYGYSPRSTRVTVSVSLDYPCYVMLFEKPWLYDVIRLSVPGARMGDYELDKRFAARSLPEHTVSHLLASADLRRKVLQIRPRQIRLTNHEAAVVKSGIVTEEEQLLGLIDLSESIARTAESSHLDNY